MPTIPSPTPFPFLLTFTLALVLSISATNIPLTTNLTLLFSTNQTTALTMNSITCTPPPPLFKRETRPKSLDCTSAIAQLPRSSKPGAFHVYGADDGFKLPVSKSYDKCNVSVRMRDGSSFDHASWAGIRYAAIGLVEQCERPGKFGILRTGGSGLVGIANKIVVEVSKVQLEGSGNGTLIAREGTG